jgi:uncharacterized protein YutE (UPF0331/DUF86 family)
MKAESYLSQLFTIVPHTTRNRLVHRYWEVDDRQVHQLLCSRLQDFRRFLKEMAHYLALDEIAE